METPSTPIWRTPEFWRKLAKEWRGPETFATDKGICRQLICALQGSSKSTEAREFLEKFRPAHAKAYFFLIGDESRHLRAELCDKIADHLENETNQTQASPAQDQIQQ